MLLVAVAALAAALPAISCGDLGNDEDVDEEFYGYFLRDAKAMEEMGLPVYWLGRGFTAGALTFQGPYGVEFGGEVEGGGVFMRYLRGGLDTGLEITVYSPDAWELAKSRILNPQPLAGEGKVTRRTVAVTGRQAELISIPNLTFRRPVSQLRLILDLGEVVIVAVARSGGQGPSGTDYSLFIKNPDLLVDVIDENLRPYPE